MSRHEQVDTLVLQSKQFMINERLPVVSLLTQNCFKFMESDPGII